MTDLTEDELTITLRAIHSSIIDAEQQERSEKLKLLKSARDKLQE